jgi:hypothetical protein
LTDSSSIIQFIQSTLQLINSSTLQPFNRSTDQPINSLRANCQIFGAEAIIQVWRRYHDGPFKSNHMKAKSTTAIIRSIKSRNKKIGYSQTANAIEKKISQIKKNAHEGPGKEATLSVFGNPA